MLRREVFEDAARTRVAAVRVAMAGVLERLGDVPAGVHRRRVLAELDRLHDQTIALGNSMRPLPLVALGPSGPLADEWNPPDGLGSAAHLRPFEPDAPRASRLQMLPSPAKAGDTDERVDPALVAAIVVPHATGSCCGDRPCSRVGTLRTGGAS